MPYANQRIAYGEALKALGAENRNIVALEADLGKSTMSCLFQDAFPERYFEMGIAEANMASVAAGLAQTGKIPFIHSFAVFASGRAYDQLRQTIAIGGLNVKVCGSSAGLSDFGDGATHQSVEDIALMRAIPGMTVLCPVDANEAAKAVRAMAAIDGPCYIRINRNDYESLIPEEGDFPLGLPTVLRHGTDVTVFTFGYMAVLAVKAAEGLKDRVSVRVVNVSTLKPIDDSAMLKAAEGSKAIVTVEEHSLIGGLGSALALSFAGDGRPFKTVGLQDTFGCSAHNYAELLDHFGLTVENITGAILEAAK